MQTVKSNEEISAHLQQRSLVADACDSGHVPSVGGRPGKGPEDRVNADGPDEKADRTIGCRGLGLLG